VSGKGQGGKDARGCRLLAGPMHFGKHGIRLVLLGSSSASVCLVPPLAGLCVKPVG